MPRNASGNYTLPLPAVVTGTVIESVWANTTLNDLASSVTDSLDRYGRGGMVAPFRMVDGTVSVPAISFSSETNTGLYRSSAGVASISVLGVEQQTWTSAGTTVATALNVIGELNATGPLEIGGGIQITGGVSRFLGGNQVLITSSANASLAPFTTRTFTTNLTPILQVLGATGATAAGLFGRFSADNSPPFVFLSKSRNNTVGSHTIVQIGDCFGSINFGGSDGVNIIDAGRVAMFADAAPGVDSMPSRMSFWVNNSSNQPIERMRLNPTGLAVGPAGTVPAAVIHAKGGGEMYRLETTAARGGGQNYIRFIDPTGTSGFLGFAASDNTFYVRNDVAAGDLMFGTNATEYMRLTSTGLFGVGPVTPLVKMHVKSVNELFRLETTAARGSGNAYFSFYDPTGRKGYFGFPVAADDVYLSNEMAGGIYFSTNGSARMHIGQSGLVGIPTPATIGQLDVTSAGAGIISKTTSENGSVAALGVWNLNPNAVQWYVTLSGVDTHMYAPRGNQVFFVGATARFAITGTGAQAVTNLSAVNGANSVTLFGAANPMIQWFASGVADWRVAVVGDASMRWDYGGAPTYRMTLTNSGQLLIGTSYVSPGLANLNGQSWEGSTGYGVLNHASGTANGTNYIYFGYAGSSIGSVSQATTASVAFNTTSDGRLKENVVTMPDVGAIVDALQPRLFNFKVEPETTLMGLIAQEAVEVLPEIVHHDEVYDSWGIDYGKLTPLLLREIQSLRARVAALGG